MRKILAFLSLAIAISACSGGANSSDQANADSTAARKKKFIPREKEFYPSGAIQMAGKVENEKREGPWASWFESGQLQSEAVFRDGVMDGQYAVYWENGQRRIQGQWNKGKETGTWYFFDEKGDTATVKKFD